MECQHSTDHGFEIRGGRLSGWKKRRERFDRCIEAAKESDRNLDESLDTYERYIGPASATL